MPTLPVPSSASMTGAERASLCVILRRRENSRRPPPPIAAAELVADAERQLSAMFSFDDDATWKEAYAAADVAVRDAKLLVAARCAELGIPQTVFAGAGSLLAQARREHL